MTELYCLVGPCHPTTHQPEDIAELIFGNLQSMKTADYAGFIHEWRGVPHQFLFDEPQAWGKRDIRLFVKHFWKSYASSVCIIETGLVYRTVVRYWHKRYDSYKSAFVTERTPFPEPLYRDTPYSLDVVDGGWSLYCDENPRWQFGGVKTLIESFTDESEAETVFESYKKDFYEHLSAVKKDFKEQASRMETNLLLERGSDLLDYAVKSVFAGGRR